MIKKVLFVATITAHIIGFHIPYLKWFNDQGYEVHVASNGIQDIPYCDKHFNLPFTRNPFSLNNIKAFKELKHIIKENGYWIIHCHTPVGGVLTRIAAKYSRKEYGTKVIYTAHGFHFYKGSPIINWLVFYPIEKYLSRFTDTLITINSEDYFLAKKRFYCKRVELVHGVGVDLSKFDFDLTDDVKNHYLKEFNLNTNDFIFISIGELNKNKNHILQINAMREIVKSHPNAKLLIAGIGPLMNYYTNIIHKYNLDDNVYLIGYRKDIPVLLKISNCLLSTSFREGLPVNVIEGMMCNLPIIATNSRGQRDLVNSQDLVGAKDSNELIEKMNNVIASKNISVIYDTNKFELSNILDKMKSIYINTLLN